LAAADVLNPLITGYFVGNEYLDYWAELVPGIQELQPSSSYHECETTTGDDTAVPVGLAPAVRVFDSSVTALATPEWLCANELEDTYACCQHVDDSHGTHRF